jgi:hypothetical protein
LYHYTTSTTDSTTTTITTTTTTSNTITSTSQLSADPRPVPALDSQRNQFSPASPAVADRAAYPVCPRHVLQHHMHTTAMCGANSSSGSMGVSAAYMLDAVMQRFTTLAAVDCGCWVE